MSDSSIGVRMRYHVVFPNGLIFVWTSYRVFVLIKLFLNQLPLGHFSPRSSFCSLHARLPLLENVCIVIIFFCVFIPLDRLDCQDSVRRRGSHHGRRVDQPRSFLPHHDDRDSSVDALQGGRPYSGYRVGYLRRGMHSSTRWLAGCWLNSLHHSLWL